MPEIRSFRQNSVESSASQSFPVLQTPSSYLGGDHLYYIEDESGRLELSFSEFGRELSPVTGTCMAIRGFERPDGKFEFKDYLLPGLAPSSRVATYAAIVSGLQFGHDEQDDLSIDLLFDFLMGNHQLETQIPACQISSVVCLILGIQSLLVRNDMGMTMYVVVIPGSTDPVGCALPQHPFKRGILPSSAKSPNTVLLANPSVVSLEGGSFLLTSGQNIEDMLRYTNDKDPLKMAELVLNSRHIAPSAPDTLCRL
ncbi:hypothetical protein PSACC_03684 [Paramicrosporidium saccamoebae]|uniref:Uncharacterized protein n=1 Tax=Paramicrosporidium saccamoebae TaxID=1246581 RepID=A0A2H9TFN1_9FUNG|nr:hypothetical protein PSACC_03684 [Paramicrosporidium saccamoebae]